MRLSICRILFFISFFYIAQKSVAQDTIDLYKDILDHKISQIKEDHEFCLNQLEEKIEYTIFLDHFSNRRYDSIMSSIRLLKSFFIEDNTKRMIEYLSADCKRINFWMRQNPLNIYDKEINDLIIKFDNEKPNGYYSYKKELREFYNEYHAFIKDVNDDEKFDARGTTTDKILKEFSYDDFLKSMVNLLNSLPEFYSKDEKRLQQILDTINTWNNYNFYFHSFQEMKSKLEYFMELTRDMKYYKSIPSVKYIFYR